MIPLSSIFSTNQHIIIGAIHLPPLPDHREFPGFDIAIKNALLDLTALEEGGVTGIIFENNYDIPHVPYVSSHTADVMTTIGASIRNATHLPLGISVLWNDYRTALTIAKHLQLDFIRIPVFVDTVHTDYGTINGVSQEVISLRKEMGAEDIALFTDIHVKHARILSTDDIYTSAKNAICEGSDALIITGKWTGDAPDMKEVMLLREKFPNAQILLGSGVSEENVHNLFKYANGAIISTSLKENIGKHSINVKPYHARIQREKVERLIQAI
ncbi:MAG: BtpA/SgcQ family protein [Candidatus Yonathbacteria bacterium]|nr:BtpA/SgcQ family protein [Candidatus Yonathbacteria bacterium]NTW47623.1 BtpA/SgcQ family protein [Candidatus Yonathbacteria bacterium]